MRESGRIPCDADTLNLLGALDSAGSGTEDVGVSEDTPVSDSECARVVAAGELFFLALS